MNEKERHEIEALLPWHAAGTLSRRDADRVEQALAGDCELARRCDLVRQESTYWWMHAMVAVWLLPWLWRIGR